MPLIPAPPMPTKCTAPSSASDGTGAVQAATSAALIARSPPTVQHDVGQPLVGVGRPRPRPRAGRTPASAAGSVSSGTTCPAIQSAVRSASSTSSPPPASTTGRALRRCSPLPMGSGTKAAGQPDGGQLGDGHRPGPAQRQVGGGVGEVHALQVVDDHVGRAARAGAAGTVDVGVLRARGRAAPGRPAAVSASAAATAARFSVGRALRAAEHQQRGPVGVQPELPRAPRPAAPRGPAS